MEPEKRRSRLDLYDSDHQDTSSRPATPTQPSRASRASQTKATPDTLTTLKESTTNFWKQLKAPKATNPTSHHGTSHGSMEKADTWGKKIYQILLSILLVVFLITMIIFFIKQQSPVKPSEPTKEVSFSSSKRTKKSIYDNYQPTHQNQETTRETTITFNTNDDHKSADNQSSTAPQADSNNGGNNNQPAQSAPANNAPAAPSTPKPAAPTGTN